MRNALFIVLSALSLPAAAQTMEPGQWQFTSTITSSLLPQPQVSTSTQCVSKEDASDPTRFTGKEGGTGFVRCVVPGPPKVGEKVGSILLPQRPRVGDKKPLPGTVPRRDAGSARGCRADRPSHVR